MEPLYPHIRVQLVGRDGNAFTVLGSVTKAMRRHGLIPTRGMADSRGFANQRENDSRWQTGGVCHGAADCGAN